MRLMLTLMAAAASATLFAAAYADEPTPAAAPAAAEQQDAAQPAPQAAPEMTQAQRDRRERQVRRCRRESFTGSRLPARVCATQAELDGLEHEARTLLDDAQRLPVQETDWARPGGP